MNQREIWNARFGAEEDYVFGTSPNAFLRAQAYRWRPRHACWPWPMAKGATACFWPNRAMLLPP
jgi:hypothetical protein